MCCARFRQKEENERGDDRVSLCSAVHSGTNVSGERGGATAGESVDEETDGQTASTGLFLPLRERKRTLFCFREDIPHAASSDEPVLYSALRCSDVGGDAASVGKVISDRADRRNPSPPPNLGKLCVTSFIHTRDTFVL